MTRSRQGESERARRVFSHEFKVEAVRLLRERRGLGVSLAQIGREFDVRPDVLRRWARQLDPQSGGGGGRWTARRAPARECRGRGAAAAAGECGAAPGAGVPKKSGGVLRERVAVKYACIARHRRAFPVRLMCRVLAVSPAGFYAAQRRAPSTRAQRDQALRLRVRAVHTKSRRRYGAPRIHAELKAQGEAVAKKRIARLMREDGLVGRRPRRFVRTTDSRHADPVAPNVLARQFGVAQVAAPDRVWVSDISVPQQAA